MKYRTEFFVSVTRDDDEIRHNRTRSELLLELIPFIEEQLNELKIDKSHLVSLALSGMITDFIFNPIYKENER